MTLSPIEFDGKRTTHKFPFVCQQIASRKPLILNVTTNEERKEKWRREKQHVQTDWSVDDDEDDGVYERNWQRRGVRKLIRKDKYKCFIAAAQTDTDENEEKEHERR